MHPVVHIGVVGCGAGAVSFLRHLIENAAAQDKAVFDITIFEQAKDFGVGLAYQSDLDTLLINKPLELMAAHATELDDFQKWLENHPEHKKFFIDENSTLNLGHEVGIPRIYVPRWLFGLYLRDRIHRLVDEGKNKGVTLHLIQSEVTDIHAIHPFAIEAIGEDIVYVDYLILCTGNNQPRDIYHLNDTPRYINAPYPAFHQLQPIPKLASIGIIGSSLTAVDITIALNKLGHTGPITMMSRSNFPIRGRGPLLPITPKHLTIEALQAINKKRAITLWDTVRLFRKEMREIGADWRFLFHEIENETTFKSFLEKELIEGKQERKWQGLLYGLHQVGDYWWHSLDMESKAIFLSRYHRAWSTNWTPIPLSNIKYLIEMLDQNLLNYATPLRKLFFDPNKDQYIAHFNGDKTIPCDWIINATGPSRYVEPADRLLFELIDKGIIRENPFGGIDIDFDTSAIIDSRGEKNTYIRLLGHNATGAYYYMSCLELIAIKSKKVAEDIVQRVLLETTIKI